MNDTLDLLEQRLVDGYRQLASQYEKALSIVQAPASPTSCPPGEIHWMPTLQEALQTVAGLDARLADDKSAWAQSGRSPGTELRTILDRVAAQIRTLAEHIDRQVAQLVARKERLVPKMDEFIRQRWMLNAYEKVGQAQKT